jgi:type II secretory pathway component PulK
MLKIAFIAGIAMCVVFVVLTVAAVIVAAAADRANRDR